MRNKTRLPKIIYEIAAAIRISQLEQDDKPHSKRVANVLRLLSYLGGAINTEEKTLAARVLGRELRRYRWRVQLSSTSEGYRATFFPADRGLSPEEEWEYNAVRNLLDLTLVKGALSRLRQCAYAGCKRWFYAAKTDQKFCTRGLCRQNHYYSDPEHKAKHRVAVCKGYKDRKLRERRALELLREGKTRRRRSKARKSLR